VGAKILPSIYTSVYFKLPTGFLCIVGYGISPTVGYPDLMWLYPRVPGRGLMSTEIEQIDWTVVSDVKASERRTQVLQALCEKPRMTGELANELDLSTKWIRQQIKWLEERDLVEDLTESKHNYKLYRATERGEQVVEVL
jgi:predicted transcriptional regulator